MVRFLPEFLTRHRETTSLLRAAAERTQFEPRLPRAWRVTAAIALSREDDPSRGVDLQPGTLLRYEGSRFCSAYWNGTVAWTDRYFSIVDGEHAGARVTHAQWTYEDEGGSSSDAFPPAGLEPVAEHSPAND